MATADSVSEMSQAGPPSEFSGDHDPYDSEDESGQDMDEVWFAGGHGDVGGGWEMERGTKSTSHVPLVWMVREAMKAGLQFDIEKVVAMGCSEVFSDPWMASRAAAQRQNAKDAPPDVPDIRIEASSPPISPQDDTEVPPEMGAVSTGSDDTGSKEPSQVSSAFHEMMHKAHLARVHDSLNYDCGMSFSSVLTWKLMEYLPFRLMNLQSDGSWKPIRWPLACGEVRGIPNDVRVHGSVIRRMKLDKNYRPGNLIVGGGGRGTRTAPKEYGMGQWECVANSGDPVGEIWKKCK